MIRKLMLLVILVAFFGASSHAGENQDKRKAKREARMQEQRDRERQAFQERERDLRAEDELYKEIEVQERLLSKLRKKLTLLREVNSRKYGVKNNFPQEKLEYVHQDYEFDRHR